METLTHFNRKGEAKMVDVSGKKPTLREAKASATVFASPNLIHLIEKKALPKGDVLSVAKVAGIQAAKKTHELIPMCHPLQLNHIEVDVTLHKDSIRIISTVKALDRTGVEMEALTAVAIASLTIYDMCKSFEKGITISDVMLLKKSGGKSGAWKREIK
ncbi:MAG: cyclic pyranopterin monophosphate synthase MoaC [Candidatus Omnitrophica bacterium]|nr:cyclic pyranopterin monophosphate synthase MoaC [Candidatus Omnitrophota bacterium]